MKDTYESTYYRTCHGVYGVYSITSESHLNQVEYYLEAAQSSKRIKQNIPIILVGYALSEHCTALLIVLLLETRAI